MIDKTNIISWELGENQSDFNGLRNSHFNIGNFLDKIKLSGFSPRIVVFVKALMCDLGNVSIKVENN